MSLTIGCPKCGKQYRVGDQMAGKQARCQQCSTVFQVAAPQAPQVVAAPHDPLGDISLASLPAADPLQRPAPGTGTTNPLGSANPLGTSPAAPGGSPSSAWHQQGVDNPSGGPSNSAMRLVAGGLALAGVFLLAINVVLDRTQGEIYLAPLLLSPLAIIFGIAGVISPDVLRSAGKYGGHLSWHYKAIGGVLGVVALIATGLLVLACYSAGYFGGHR